MKVIFWGIGVKEWVEESPQTDVCRLQLCVPEC